MRQIVGYILAAALLAGIASGQPDETPYQTFVKISHSSDGTYALDSTGQAWKFDIEKGAFVETDRFHESSTKSSTTVEDYARDGMMLPPEVRCTDIISGDVVDFFDEVVVAVDERVEGSVFSFRDVTVYGLVTGDVVSFRTVTVEDGAEVRGNVVAKDVRESRTGRIRGQHMELSFPELVNLSIPFAFDWTRLLPIVFTGIVIFICLIVSAIVPKPLRRVQTRVETEPFKSFLMGIIGWFAILPVFILLLITIVGIPVAFLAYPLIIVAAIVLGFASVSVTIGERVGKALNWPELSIYTTCLIGVFAVQLLLVLSSLLSMIGLRPLGGVVVVFYILIASVAVTIGMGGVILTRFGVKRRQPKVVPTPPQPKPAPPPLQTAPESSSETPQPPPPKPPPPPDSD